MSSTDIFAALRWWVVLVAIGTAAVPLAHWLFGRLPDKGYAFSKMLGLLLASYVFWLAASLGFVANNTGGALLGVAAVVALSAWAWRQDSGAVWGWLKANGRYVLTAELAFALLFLLWVWVRANNPSITATEKPMEFAFFNSASTSPVYPPLDPWLSGFSISYYYFGYVMVSVVGRLAAVPEAIGFNLAIAWLVAGSGLGAFGLVYNLIASQREKIGAAGWTLALLAFVALPLAGNGEMALEVAYGRGWGSEATWAWLDMQDLRPEGVGRPRFLDSEGNPSSSWWWWRASRVIREYHLGGRVEDGLTPIAEFPGFSFVLGDMHPHVLALPFAFLSLGLALQWFLWASGGGAEGQRSGGAEGRRSVFQSAIRVPHSAFLGLTAVVIGGLSFLNTWDVLIHLFVLVAAYALGRWRAEGRLSEQIWGEAAVLGVGFVLSAYLLYLPFYLGFRSQAGAPFILPMLMRPTRLVHFLIIFGMPLLAIVPFVVANVLGGKRGRWQTWLSWFIGLPLALLAIKLLWSWLIASNPAGYGTVTNLANEVGAILPPVPTSGSGWGWGAQAVAALLPAVLSARLTYIALTVFLSALVATAVWLWQGELGTGDEGQGTNAGSSAPLLPRSPAPFLLLLILTGSLLTLGPEYVYLKDNFGQRLNTIFKFYYQAWVFWGVAGLVAVDWLWARARPLGAAVGGGYLLLLGVGLLFPYYGVQSRAVEYRGPVTLAERRPLTLNGLAFIEQFNQAEYEAIGWLRGNAPAGSVVLEATGGAYSYYGRVSANTGLPTVLGWANHEFQWRGDSTAEPGLRVPLVKEIYDTQDWARAAQLLNQYGVDYIFVGSLETADHNAQGLAKFANNLEVAFQNSGVTIYRWQGE